MFIYACGVGHYYQSMSYSTECHLTPHVHVSLGCLYKHSCGLLSRDRALEADCSQENKQIKMNVCMRESEEGLTVMISLTLERISSTFCIRSLWEE